MLGADLLKVPDLDSGISGKSYDFGVCQEHISQGVIFLIFPCEKSIKQQLSTFGGLRNAQNTSF